MHFYYPNFNNDMWRVLGAAFFQDRERFVLPGKKCFDKERIVAFLRERGIGIYDVAVEVERLKGNASDAFLRILKTADIPGILRLLPDCRAVDTTGTLATETLSGILGAAAPPVGGKSPFRVGERSLQLYRTPSTSRAYPLAFEKKVEAYRKMFCELGML